MHTWEVAVAEPAAEDKEHFVLSLAKAEEGVGVPTGILAPISLPCPTAEEPQPLRCSLLGRRGPYV